MEGFDGKSLEKVVKLENIGLLDLGTMERLVVYFELQAQVMGQLIQVGPVPIGWTEAGGRSLLGKSVPFCW